MPASFSSLTLCLVQIAVDGHFGDADPGCDFLHCTLYEEQEIALDLKGENKGHYAPGVISNGNLYISDRLSLDLDTRKVAEGGPKEHMALALHNVERVLNKAGLSREDVVQCRVYISDVS